MYYACTFARFVLGWRFQVIRPAAVRIPQLERPPASLTDSSFPVTGRRQDVLNGDPKEGVQPEMFIPYTPTLRIGSLSLRRVADHFRSSQRRDVASGWPGDDTFPPSSAMSSAQAPDEQVVKAEEGERLRRAVSRLAEPERSVVLAYYLGEMSVTEISRALNMPEGTVKTRLHRGRQALRKELMVP